MDCKQIKKTSNAKPDYSSDEKLFLGISYRMTQSLPADGPWDISLPLQHHTHIGLPSQAELMEMADFGSKSASHETCPAEDIPRRATSTPHKNKTKSMGDDGYEKFRRHVKNPMRKQNLFGFYELPDSSVISSQIVLHLPVEENYEMIFSREFNMEEFEAFEDCAYTSANADIPSVQYHSLNRVLKNEFVPIVYPNYFYPQYYLLYYCHYNYAPYHVIRQTI